ncbi:MAG TPA: nucleotide pyrophosphatase/phosphodiesterase family protein, partial [Pirellulales bacterium]|nr:nucleotide pyrophosphatase/phosphodiesterase family protein [Pirellulales bacterium]
PSFPCVTCPVQANMTTGVTPRAHGVVANGFYWRDKQQVEMWTAWNECIQRPQIWDRLRQHSPGRTSAVWFPLHSKGCGADFICTPAPIHNPDGSESLWCYTKPTEMYGALRDKLGHFPLKHFWGPLANINSTAWIVDSAVVAAGELRPDFFYIYLPHLDYAAQKAGPNSEAAMRALGELDGCLARLVAGFGQAYADQPPLWIVASEYPIVDVNHVTYPNRLLREAGLLAVREQDGGELLDFAASRAFALADHQLAHVFVQQPGDIGRVVDVFRGQEGIAEVLAGEDRARYELDHERSGEVVLVSTANSWQAYYWWLDDARAPAFARTVDIHRKPGYDPVELFFDPATRSIPLQASLVKGSHGAPAVGEQQRGVILSSERGVLTAGTLADTDVCGIVLRQFGI